MFDNKKIPFLSEILKDYLQQLLTNNKEYHSLIVTKNINAWKDN